MNYQQKIAQYRKYLVDAKLNSMLRKTNSHCTIVTLVDGSMRTVELSESTLSKGLEIFFELPALDVNKRSEAEPMILESYKSLLKKGNDKLNDEGYEFMNNLVKNIAELANERGLFNKEEAL